MKREIFLEISEDPQVNMISRVWIGADLHEEVGASYNLNI